MVFPFIHYNYAQIYGPKLQQREKTFREVLVKLLRRKSEDVTIVETGTVNELDNWAGHGQSTVLFDQLVKSVGGRVFSVDINPEAVVLARKLVSDNVILTLGNSIDFLKAFSRPIDLLYLDSYDLDKGDPLPSAKHTLLEFVVAYKCLHYGSIVCVDDTWWGDGKHPFGKGMLICDLMGGLKTERITSDGMQVAWMIK